MKNKNIVIVPKSYKDLFDDLKFTFGDAILVDEKSNINELKEILKDKNVYFVNFNDLYRKLLIELKNNKDMHAVLTHPVAHFPAPGIVGIFQNVMEYYDRSLYKDIFCTDESLVRLLNKKDYDAKLLKINTNKKYKNNKPTKSLGIISTESIPNHNYYNALSAARYSEIKKVKIYNSNFETKRFCELFDINAEYYDFGKENDSLSNNEVNVYPAFTDMSIEKVLASFDSGIPCIVGNTTIFDNYSILKENCTLKSDDDILEIASKINSTIKNKDKILKEYQKFRKNYIK